MKNYKIQITSLSENSILYFSFFTFHFSLLELQSRETHHCDSHKTYGDECDTETTERLWHIAVCHLFADSTHADNGKEPTEARAESIDERIENATEILSV